MSAEVGTTLTYTWPLTDSAGASLTGKAASITTVTARLIAPDGTVSTITPSSWAEVGSTGTYTATLVADFAGGHYVHARYSESGQVVQNCASTIQVVESADPAAVAVVAQGHTWSDLTDPILDAGGDPIPDGESDITITLYDANDVDQSTGITVAHVDAGQYRVSKDIAADAAVGTWGGMLTYDDGAGLEREQVINFTVITPAQLNPSDPEAVAAAIMATPMGDVEPDTLGYYVKALFTRPVRSGNG